MARALCSEGFPVLRFDPHGVGDSEGEGIEDGPAVYNWYKIQTGHFAADTCVAASFLVQKADVKEVVLAGLCGGSITALLAADRSPHVTGLILVAHPPMIDVPSENYQAYVSSRVEPWEAKTNIKRYLTKLFSLSAWHKFITGKTNYKLLVRTFKTFTSRRHASLESKEGKLHRIFNEMGWAALKQFLAKRYPVLFVLPEFDRETVDFQAELAPRLAALEESQRSGYEIFEIAQANHLLTLAEHQQMLIGKVCAWMNHLKVR